MKIHLVRHGQPDFTDRGKICLGRLDLPLSRLGCMQGVLLGRFFRNRNLRVISSGMLRADQTAIYIGQDIESEPDFKELDVGEWDGLSFSAIRRIWPELYEKRGEDPFAVCMPGGERPQDCLARAKKALDRIACQGEKETVIVAHAGVIRLLLCSIMGKTMKEFQKIPQPYGCVNTLIYENSIYTVEQIALNPVPQMDAALADRLIDAYGTPEHVRRHMHAVEKMALSLVQGLDVNRQALSIAARMHDIARTEKEHAQIGAQLLQALGYADIAEIVACHHELAPEDEERMSEKTLLYLADKYVCGEEAVTLKERFAASEKKLASVEAKCAHERRYQQAQRVEEMIISTKKTFRKGA